MKRAPRKLFAHLFAGALMLWGSGSLLAADLLSVYRMAVDSDPKYRAARAARDAALEAKPQARALLLPGVSLKANVTRNRLNQVLAEFPQFGGESLFNSKSYSLSLVQPLFNQAYFVQLRQADSQIAQAEADYRAAEQALITRVAGRYFDILAARDDLAFARAEKSAVARQLEQASKRFEVGLLAITDVHEAQARFDQTVATEIAAANGLDVSREALHEIIGQAPAGLDALHKKIALTMPEPADIEHWVSTALKNNLDLTAARFSAETAREEIERIRSGHLPTLDLVAGRTYTDSSGGSFGSRTSTTDSVAVQFNLPLYQGGLVTSKTRQARKNFEQAQEGVEQQRRATVRQVRAGYLSVGADISRVRALQQAVVSAQSALQATRAGFEVGTRTIVDVLTGESNLYRAQRDLAGARYDYILNSLRLKQAAGQLSINDLAQVNGWLVK